MQVIPIASRQESYSTFYYNPTGVKILLFRLLPFGSKTHAINLNCSVPSLVPNRCMTLNNQKINNRSSFDINFKKQTPLCHDFIGKDRSEKKQLFLHRLATLSDTKLLTLYEKTVCF